jgi:purine nucleosidase
MSGYFAGPPGRSSWNVICDPASAAIALATRWPRSVQVGEDVTTHLRLTEGEVMERFQHPLLKLVLGMAPGWFSNRSHIVFHDPLAAAIIFDESLCRLTSGHIEIDPADGRTAIREAASGPHEVPREVRKEEFWRAFFSPFN